MSARQSGIVERPQVRAWRITVESGAGWVDHVRHELVDAETLLAAEMDRAPVGARLGCTLVMGDRTEREAFRGERCAEGWTWRFGREERAS